MVLGNNAQQPGAPVQQPGGTQAPPPLATQAPPQETSQQQQATTQPESKNRVSPEISDVQSKIRKSEVQPLRDQVNTLTKASNELQSQLDEANAVLKTYQEEADAHYDPAVVTKIQAGRDSKITMTKLENSNKALQRSLDAANAELNNLKRGDYAREQSTESGIPLEALLKCESREEVDRLVEIARGLGVGNAPQNTPQPGQTQKVDTLPNPLKPNIHIPEVLQTRYEASARAVEEAMAKAVRPVK